MENGAQLLDPKNRDPLYRMRAYRLAGDLLEESWRDVEELIKHPPMAKVCAQLYAAVGSISANLGEGYAHSSGKDRARFFEYALGSARESISWYKAAQPILGKDTVACRLAKLDEIRRILTAVIPRERDRLIRPLKRQ